MCEESGIFIEYYAQEVSEITINLSLLHDEIESVQESVDLEVAFLRAPHLPSNDPATPQNNPLEAGHVAQQADCH